jgi:CHASE3 domain sensor protein
MRRLLDAFSITQKLSAAFGVFLLILLVVSLASLRGASRSEESVHRVVDRIQPAMLAVTDLETQVQRAAAATGFYLKNREEVHRALYLEENQALAGALEQVVRCRPWATSRSACALPFWRTGSVPLPPTKPRSSN